jgi:hypothetical protein
VRDVTISSGVLDDRLAALAGEDGVALHLIGSFTTAGVYRWGKYANRNLGKGWTVDGDAEISLIPEQVDNQPIYCLAGPALSITGITVRGNHSAIAKDWQGSLRTGGVLLEGTALIDRVTFNDFGAIGAETFVAEIVGSGDITNCLYTEHNPSFSNDQVTVFRTIASENGDKVSLVRSVHQNNTTNTPGSKLVQAHTIYQSPGQVRFNKSIGADVLYYGDYFNNSDITIEENQADDCVHGVQLKLSPIAGNDTEMPKHFSHENYTIGVNRFASKGANVSLDTCGPTTATRYIRNIKVHNALSLENFGGEVVRFGDDLNARKGCFR